MPGVVDVHTDNLERQVQPRVNARWPSRSAMLSHDQQTAAAGVTTVLDALCVGDLGFDVDRLKTFQDGVRDLDALADTGLLKSEHFLHLRCETPAHDVIDLVEPVIDHPRVRMVSFMDHSPGVGQYADINNYRKIRRRAGMTEVQGINPGEIVATSSFDKLQAGSKVTASKQAGQLSSSNTAEGNAP